MVLTVKEAEADEVAPPVAAPEKEPPMFVQPHRVTVVDIDELGNWLVARICAKYPQHTERAIFSWLKGCTNDNECLFLRAAGAIALASVHRSFLTPCWVEEVFVLRQTDDDEPHSIGLYTDIRTWAISLGATHIVVERFTDVSRADISLEIGTPKRVPESWVRLVDIPV